MGHRGGKETLTTIPLKCIAKPEKGAGTSYCTVADFAASYLQALKLKGKVALLYAQAWKNDGKKHVEFLQPQLFNSIVPTH